MDRSECYVVPDQRNGGWKVNGPAAAAECHTRTQSDAIEEACTQLRRGGGGAVLIHGRRGRVQDRRTVQRES
ncbi:DUF2188 domain-containing protein [Saccharopolyspora griseoalba]|uniref:DUF2188 domain-containing protein n=1 Tax=Saccharopolyspora griseoalba TaxID=1431848 RepID=A0ABW2LQJ7_9PSEU